MTAEQEQVEALVPKVRAALDRVWPDDTPTPLVNAVAAALAEDFAVRDESWVEWGVRRTSGMVGSVAQFQRDKRTAEECARNWPGTLVSRTVTAEAWASVTSPAEPQP